MHWMSAGLYTMSSGTAAASAGYGDHNLTISCSLAAFSPFQPAVNSLSSTLRNGDKLYLTSKQNKMFQLSLGTKDYITFKQFDLKIANTQSIQRPCISTPLYRKPACALPAPQCWVSLIHYFNNKTHWVVVEHAFNLAEAEAGGFL